MDINLFSHFLLLFLGGVCLVFGFVLLGNENLHKPYFSKRTWYMISIALVASGLLMSWVVFSY